MENNEEKLTKSYIYDLQERLLWLENRQRQLGWLLLDGLFVVIGLIIGVYLILK